jgi:hypothetical protein
VGVTGTVCGGWRVLSGGGLWAGGVLTQAGLQEVQQQVGVAGVVPATADSGIPMQPACSSWVVPAGSCSCMGAAP